MVRWVAPALIAIIIALANGQARADYQVAAVANAGVIRGKILIGAAETRVERFFIAKDQAMCGNGPRAVPLVRANGSGLLDAVVYLERVDRGKPFPAASRKISINQKRCRFEPHLSVVADGGIVEAVNSDSVLHNIHITGQIGRQRRSVMNVSQPQKGDIASQRVDLTAGNGMTVTCAAHNFMRATIFVAANPYYAIVDINGRFKIDGVPPGRYVIKSWHGVLGERGVGIDVSPLKTTSIELSY